jgi:geranylgeranyl reductase family protein
VPSALLHTDILILGAGPGGAFCALTLAKAGIPCMLVDKAVFPRDKVCGDALSGKVVEVMRKLDPQLVDQLTHDSHHLGSWGVTFVAPNRKALRVPFRKDLDKRQAAPGFISRRVDFDNLLVEECRRHPSIQLIEGLALTRFHRTEQGFTAHSEDCKTEIRAKLVIAADGAHSRFAKAFGGMSVDPEHYCAGLRAYYKGVKDLDADNFIELHFLENFLPGYFWIFPLPNGYANVGVGMRSDVVGSRKVNLKKEMMRLIETDPEISKRFVGATLEGPIAGFGLPLGSRKRRISGDNYLLVGDAASLIDPFTGEGIGNAMYSGYFAAQQAQRCIEQHRFAGEFNSQYDQVVYDRLWDELKLGRRMQKLVKYPWLFNLVVNKANKNRTLRETISCMFEDLDLRERLRSPGFYLKLLFSNGN